MPPESVGRSQRIVKSLGLRGKAPANTCRLNQEEFSLPAVAVLYERPSQNPARTAEIHTAVDVDAGKCR